MRSTARWSVKPRQKEDILENILDQRGWRSDSQVADFLNPPAPAVFVANPRWLGIEPQSLNQAVGAIKTAVDNNSPIIIHGDYDVDGIVATSILWKTIYQYLGFSRCLPFIPNRFEHGYGLSQESVGEVLDLIDSRFSRPQPEARKGGNVKPLLITVDCGVTAAEVIEFAKAQSLEVLVVDHHVRPEKLPSCQLVWTDKLCAAGIAWVIAELLGHPGISLDLVALATLADLQPLIGPNRSLVKYGLAELNRTQNLGLKALIKKAGLASSPIGTFEVSWLLAPRLNASGRLANALQSLRLLCTTSENQAEQIAAELKKLNAERQALTQQALALAPDLGTKGTTDKIRVVVHPEFHQGIIGLVAARLAAEAGAPAVVISRGEEFSKASARSVNGFSIVDFLRSLGPHFEDLGGHPGAAGFTIRTEKIESFLQAIRERQADLDLPERFLAIDAEVKFEELNLALFEKVRRLEPFGLANPEPVFLLKGAKVLEVRTVGSQNQHLKLKIGRGSVRITNEVIDCIAFGLAEEKEKTPPGSWIDLVFSLAEDSFTGKPRLQLKIKDLAKSS